MITVYPVLRQQMEKHGVSARELAAVTGMTRLAFQLKMWGMKRWSLTDAVAICGFFSYPDVEHLFVRNYYKCKNVESQGKNNHV